MYVEIDQTSLRNLFDFIYNNCSTVDKYGENCHELCFIGGKIYAYKQNLRYVGANCETIYQQTDCLLFEKEEE